MYYMIYFYFLYMHGDLHINLLLGVTYWSFRVFYSKEYSLLCIYNVYPKKVNFLLFIFYTFQMYFIIV